MRTGRTLRVACWFVLLAPLAVTATPPAEPPIRRYHIEGQLIRNDGGPIEGVPMALAANCGELGEFGLMSTYVTGRCGQVIPNRGTPLALTDPGGRFFIDVYTYALVDSLALAMVEPGSFVMGTPFARKEVASVQALTRVYYREDEGYFFCSSGLETEDRQEGWDYSLRADTLTVE